MGKSEFLAVTHWQDAIIRQLETAGEATKRSSDTEIPNLKRAVEKLLERAD